MNTSQNITKISYEGQISDEFTDNITIHRNVHICAMITKISAFVLVKYTVYIEKIS